MGPWRLVIVVCRRNDVGMFNKIRLTECVSGVANEAKEIAQSSLTSTAVTRKAGSTQRLQRLELVIGRTPEDAALKVASHKRNGHERRVHLRESVQPVEVLEVPAVLDREKAHVSPAHVFGGDALSRLPPIRASHECHGSKSPTGGGRNWTNQVDG